MNQVLKNRGIAQCPKVTGTHWTKIGQCRGRQGRAGAGRPGKKTWEILGYGFQDMVFRTWDLNFGAWIFTLAVSKTET